jgi:cation-transporting P-type ATPase E
VERHETSVGLTAAEVEARVADGRVNVVPAAPSRTVSQIVRANVLTPVNLVIGVMLVLVIIANGISPDMLFAGVIVSNSVIGIVQELRARAALERLAVLTEPRACAIRDGERVELGVEEVVADDLLVLAPGWQVVVDGTVEQCAGLELNESLLTGESDPVPKPSGSEVLSGSFVSSGHGTYRATRIGADSYAASLAEEARRFTLVNSELRQGVNRILKVLMWVIPPIAAILLWRLLQTGDDWREALSGVVAAAVAMVPDGLVLLTSLAFMAGVVTLARRQALLRELASVELLARVDTLCLDKTGTITTGHIVVSRIVPLDGVEPDAMLAALAASDPDPNSTLQSIAASCPDVPDWTVEDTVPFSSTRKWSAASFSGSVAPGEAAVFLGAPEILLDGAHDDVSEQVRREADAGHRVVLLATAESLAGEDLPSGLTPRALVLLEDEIRSDARETLDYFSAQGVDLKVISGDHPGTVAAVARRAGVPGADGGLDARELPLDDDGALADIVEEQTVFGRVTPRQKRAMVLALQSRGRVVAMTGDGVNDVLALKDSDMGIAMGSGSGASRSVAQLVLMDDRFASLPSVLAEGRRVMNSVERAANLFIYGTVYSVIIALVIAVLGTEYPFLPRHLTLVRVLSVGIPGFVLALAPDPRRARPGFLGRVVRFSLPAGAIAGVAALVVWVVAQAVTDDLTQARTAPTVTLLAVGLGILVRLTSPLPAWRWYLVAAMAAATALSLLIPPVAEVFELAVPPLLVWLAIAASVAAANLAMRLVPISTGDDVG